MRVSIIEPLNISAERIDAFRDDLAQRGYELVTYEDRNPEPNALIERSQNAEIVILANTPYPKEVIESLNATKLLNVAFTGLNHVDLKAAEAKGIQVINAAGYANIAVAELAIGLALSLYREIPKNHDAIQLAEDFPGASSGNQIHGKTVGIIGTGRIGLETAKVFQALGANVIGYNRSTKNEAIEMGIVYHSLDEVLSRSDIVSVHLPLTDETYHLIDASAIAKMKSTAILINVARGPIVDNQALHDALISGRLAGAGIDVFDCEPPLPHDEPLLDTPNTVLTPHIGYNTQEAMELRAEIVFGNTLKFIDGNLKKDS